MRSKQTHWTMRLAVTLVLVLGLAESGLAQEAAQGAGRGHGKLDRALVDTLKKAPRPQRVIIRIKPGRERVLGNALRAHGDVVDVEHKTLGATEARR